MKKKLVLAGAGHAHMTLLGNIDEIVGKGCSVKVIGPDDRHYYSGMGAGMLGGSYTPDEICFESRKTVESRGGTFIKDKLRKIDGNNRVVYLESGKELEYDILSCNCGSSVEHDFERKADCPVYSVKPIDNLLAAREHICREGREKTLQIGIIGGGASAAEIAGNILQLAIREDLGQPILHIFCRGGFMTGFPERVRKTAVQLLGKKSVNIIERDEVVSIDGSSICTESGREHAVDLAFVASGVTPSRVFRDSGIETGADGGLAVNQFLQSVEYPEIFGGGDCISFLPGLLDKVGVYAVRQNPVLYHNVLAALTCSAMVPFRPGGGYLLIVNLGCGYGVLQKGRLFWKGKSAFMIKDAIDRRFMRKFQ